MRIVIFLYFMFISPHVGLAQSSECPFPVQRSDQWKTEILDTIWRLPEVARRAEDVHLQSKGARKLSIALHESPTDKQPYYWVKVWEDNAVAYTTHFNFFVAPENKEILYLDPSEGRMMSLSAWRKSRQLQE